jgi:hypothetical protein
MFLIITLDRRMHCQWEIGKGDITVVITCLCVTYFEYIVFVKI